MTGGRPIISGGSPVYELQLCMSTLTLTLGPRSLKFRQQVEMSVMVSWGYSCSLQLSLGSSLHPPHSLLGLCTPDTRGQIPRGGCVSPWCLSRPRYNRRAWWTHESLLWVTCNGPLHCSEYSTCAVCWHDDTAGTVTTHLAHNYL